MRQLRAPSRKKGAPPSLTGLGQCRLIVSRPRAAAAVGRLPQLLLPMV